VAVTVRRVSVSVDDAHVDSIDTVADALRGHGMEVDQVMGSLGIISGSVPEESRSALLAVTGVASVDDPRGFQLPPPDSPVQ
jgi:hypothetical protein